MQAQGYCRLCGNLGGLSDSHLMPRALYRFVRGSLSGGQDLVVVTRARSWPSSRQVSDHVLCSECEARFNENGERWVLKNCYRGQGTFKLRQSLEETPPLMGGNELLVYAAAHIASVEIRQLLYFSSSVIWRAAAHTWRYENYELERLLLGGRYQEELRRFLLGDQPFPSNAVLWVSVSNLSQPELAKTMVFPYGGRADGYHLYQFAIPGLRFHMFVGNCIPPLIHRMCTYRSPENLVYLTDKVDEEILSNFGKLSRTSKPSKRLKGASDKAGERG